MTAPNPKNCLVKDVFASHSYRVQWARFTGGDNTKAPQQQGNIMRKLLIAAIIGSFCATGALAQTSPTKKAETKARSPESIECSKQADAQGLKGKPRKVFRAKCKKDLMKKKT
jgi:hypothetical protein